ncbi:OmpA family protein [Porphyromonas loveana]|uniref:Outer membrane protein OmpA-like peptidoglycan-associated protein n=1 Tax=Porphyromonas loveana TaxID=1884669 RepID=A0A2U1FPH1_9PORP|nr:OmpA family protein [Porphyromonas loveana]PVZ14077.1 outer membrane protein OmpA-like peptidoglycan-associated protein [Porphyromonas loveana]
MKAKSLFIALVGLACTFGATAQEVTSQNKAGKNTTFQRDKASDHWFIDIAGGAGMPLSGWNNNIDLMDRISIVPTLAFGKWHEPYFATRLQFTGFDIYGYTNGSTDRYHNYFGNAHFDFMFDMMNYFGTYRPNRVFHLIPWVGIGFGYKFHSADSDGNKIGSKDDISGTVNAGLMIKFRLSRVVDFNIEGQAFASKMNFIGTKTGKADFPAMATAGLTFNLGKTEWTEVIPMDYALVNDLNNQINALRAQAEELSRRPVSCPECPEPVQAVVSRVVVDNVVYFRLNSAKIDRNQEINVYNTAEYAKTNNAPIKIVGYADEKTGTADYNMKLSERRAKAVAKMLEKYGVSADRITIDWKGSSEQIYEENAWNRIVVMSAAE